MVLMVSCGSEDYEDLCEFICVCCPNVELHHGGDWMYSMVSSLPPVDLKVDRD